MTLHDLPGSADGAWAQLQCQVEATGGGGTRKGWGSEAVQVSLALHFKDVLTSPP